MKLIIGKPATGKTQLALELVKKYKSKHVREVSLAYIKQIENKELHLNPYTKILITEVSNFKEVSGLRKLELLLNIEIIASSNNTELANVIESNINQIWVIHLIRP